MSSSSPLNTASADFFSNPALLYHQYYNPHHHQQLQEFDYNSSDQNSSISGCRLIQQTNLVASGGMVVQGGDEDHLVPLPVDSTIRNIDCASGKTTPDKAGSGGNKRKSDIRISKIRTAQGLRDRRVRLSIGIARRFFDLQDLLGFDKPSKTLEWLLTKSNKAILELSAVASSSLVSSKEITAAAGISDCCKSLSSSRSTASTDSAIQALQVSCEDSFKIVKQKVARKSARVRARARTLAKLCAGKVDHQPKINQLVMSNNEVMNGGDQISHSSANCHGCNSPSLLKSPASESHKEERNMNGVQDPKLQQELLSYGLSPSLSLDWDIGSVITQQTSSPTHRLISSRDDIEIYNRSTWDQLLDNYRGSLLHTEAYNGNWQIK